jgi:alanine or glycine:cation symporter, AGCS family
LYHCAFPLAGRWPLAAAAAHAMNQRIAMDVIFTWIGNILRWFVDSVGYLVWEFGIPAGEDSIPLVVILLIGTGFYLTIRTGFVQRYIIHGFKVTSGKLDDPDKPGDVHHFQALTTALSATVGIGNIAGVAMAIHYGGPGALFWMWVTAVVGMATKFTEVTLSQRYRTVIAADDLRPWEGTVAGGPMYYIERGLGRNFKWMAVIFATLLGITAFLTGNGIQANTVADTMGSEFGIPTWVTGLVTATVVGLVIIGGISRIGKTTAILAPVMAAVYVLGAMIVIVVHITEVPGTFGLIFSEAFNPSAGVAGTGAGAFLLTMMWGVRRGLFSNEAGQGSSPIAHAASKTDEPVSEGTVAYLGPFIDTIVICTMTGLVIIMSGAWDDRVPTAMTVDRGEWQWVTEDETGRARPVPTRPGVVRFQDGIPQRTAVGEVRVGWNHVAIERLYRDPALRQPFSGEIVPGSAEATADDGTRLTTLYGESVQVGAPLTMLGFRYGLPGNWGQYIVIFGVLLFAISTSIAWSYYGDRCATYLFGRNAVLPYKFVFVLMHFIGAVIPLTVVWELGDVFLGIVIIPNLIALIFLSRTVVEMKDDYFERRPWEAHVERRRRLREETRGGGKPS